METTSILGWFFLSIYPQLYQNNFFKVIHATPRLQKSSKKKEPLARGQPCADLNSKCRQNQREFFAEYFDNKTLTSKLYDHISDLKILKFYTP